jgi:putative ABC transport system permease protein
VALAAAAILAWAAVRFTALAPAMKMAIAYPLANRFRTGMTLAMFSLVIFSLTVFSILLQNFGATDGGENARGNLDIVATTNPTNVIPDIREALRQAGSDAGDDVAAIGRTTVFGTGQQASQDGGEFETVPVIAGDAAFYASLALSLDAIATGYPEEGDALRAILRQPGLALIDRQTLRDEFSSYAFAADVTINDDGTFEPFQLEIRDAVTGRTATVTVIGELGARLPSISFSGIYVTEETYRSVYGAPAYERLYLRLAEGASAETVAGQIESALAFRGVEAEAVAAILERGTAEDAAFNRMFQAFMALGLVVGIAGLGVIAFRSVVERRQQIGMLRAIGYQRTTVTITFLVESSFVAAIGILAGLVGGTVIGRNLMTSDQVTGGGEVAPFSVPWGELGLIVLAAYAFSLLLTWFPSYQASKVPVAEALRYE